MKGKTSEQLHVKNKRFLLTRNSQLNVTKKSYVNDKGTFEDHVGTWSSTFCSLLFLQSCRHCTLEKSGKSQKRKEHFKIKLRRGVPHFVACFYKAVDTAL